MKMKTLSLGLLTLLASLCTINAYAIDVQLKFNNNTSQALHPEGSIAYNINGEFTSDIPIEPSEMLIPAHTQNVPTDKLRKGMDLYFLEYFELFDAQGKFVTNCLESYIDISKQSAIVTMTLTQIGKQNPHYECSYKVQYV